MSGFSAAFKKTMADLENTGPQFIQISRDLNDLYWQKEAARCTLLHQLRDLDQLPPGRDEGEAFFNEFLDEMEAKATERLRDSFAAFARTRNLIAHQDHLHSVAMNALDPRYRLDLGLDAFLIDAMRAAIPSLLDKIHWPVNAMTDAQRRERMDKLLANAETLSAEREAIGEKMAAFGITPKRPDEPADGQN